MFQCSVERMLRFPSPLPEKPNGVHDIDSSISPIFSRNQSQNIKYLNQALKSRVNCRLILPIQPSRRATMLHLSTDTNHIVLPLRSYLPSNHHNRDTKR